MAYVAQMCRLLEVSSDWLLLGEETSPAPARHLEHQTVEGYTMLLKPLRNGALSPREDLLRLSNSGIFPEGSPLHTPLTWDQAEELAGSAPVILAKGLPVGRVRAVYKKVYNSSLFAVFQDGGEENPQVLDSRPGIPLEELPPAKTRQPLTFGGIVLACACGVALALLLLPLLAEFVWFLGHTF